MDDNERELVAYRIIGGEVPITIGGVKYKLVNPPPKVRLQAAEQYKRVLYENRFDNTWLTEKECLTTLVQNNLCTAEIDDNLKEMEKTIEDLKVKLYDSMFAPESHRQVREQLNKVVAKQDEILRIRHSMDHLTIQGYAEMIKRQYIIMNTLCDSETGQLIWKSLDDVDSALLERVTSFLLRNSISGKQIREIARTDPWRHIWSVGKANVFGQKAAFELTDEQRTLVLFSKMYDSAAEHPECPPDDVINDDDIFDGWMIHQRRQNEKDRMTNQFDKRMSKRNDKMGKADEVFIVAKKPEDVKRINKMNDTQAAITKRQRAAVIKQKGKAVDANFPDRKVQITQMANQQYIDKVKGKK